MKPFPKNLRFVKASPVSPFMYKAVSSVIMKENRKEKRMKKKNKKEKPMTRSINNEENLMIIIGMRKGFLSKCESLIDDQKTPSF